MSENSSEKKIVENEQDNVSQTSESKIKKTIWKIFLKLIKVLVILIGIIVLLFGACYTILIVFSGN